MEEANSQPQTAEPVEFILLNLRRLTGRLVRQLAAALQIPTSGSTEDVRQLVDAKITESGHEPMKVQVRVHKTDKGATLILEDADGTFLRAEPQEDELELNGDSPNSW